MDSITKNMIVSNQQLV